VRQIGAAPHQLVEYGGIPFEVDLGGAVVGDRKLPGLGVNVEIYRRCYSRYAARPVPLDTTVPVDYDRQLRSLRRALRLTQSALAERIGAANKAVVYQWESRKRVPSRGHCGGPDFGV
jgi:hypothetical protein